MNAGAAGAASWSAARSSPRWLLVGVYLAAGGASYTPEKIQDPCKPRPWREPEGLQRRSPSSSRSRRSTAPPASSGSAARRWPGRWPPTEARERFSEALRDRRREAGARRSAPACCGRSTTPKKPARSARSSPGRCGRRSKTSRSTRRSNWSRTPLAPRRRAELPRPGRRLARRTPALASAIVLNFPQVGDGAPIAWRTRMYEQAKALRDKLVVPIVVGTRPEAIKLVPIILALRESELLRADRRLDRPAQPPGRVHLRARRHQARRHPLGGLAPRQPERAGGLGDAALRRLLRRALRRRPRRRRPTADGRAQPAATRPRSSSTATPARRWRRRSPPSTCTSR